MSEEKEKYFERSYYVLKIGNKYYKSYLENREIKETHVEEPYSADAFRGKKIAEMFNEAHGGQVVKINVIHEVV